jgi:TRAF-like zinc-finger
MNAAVESPAVPGHLGKVEAISALEPWVGASPFILNHVIPFLDQQSRITLFSLRCVRELFDTGELRPSAASLRDARADFQMLLGQQVPIASLGLTDLSPLKGGATPFGVHRGISNERNEARLYQGSTWKSSPGLGQMLFRASTFAKTLKELIIPGAWLNGSRVLAIASLEKLEVLDISGCRFEGNAADAGKQLPLFQSTLRVLACGPTQNAVLQAWIAGPGHVVKGGAVFSRIESFTCGIPTGDYADILLDGVLGPSAATGALKRLHLVTSRVPLLFRFNGEKADAVRAVCRSLQTLEMIECELSRRLPEAPVASEEAAACLAETLLCCVSLRELRIIDPLWPLKASESFLRPIFASLGASGCPVRTLEVNIAGMFFQQPQAFDFVAFDFVPFGGNGGPPEGLLPRHATPGDSIVRAMLSGFASSISMGAAATSSGPLIAQRLENLSLFNSPITNDAGLRLVSGMFAGLRKLDLSFCRDINDAGIDSMLVAAVFVPTLQVLRLNGCRQIVFGSTLEAISKRFPALQELHIRGLHRAVKDCLKRAGMPVENEVEALRSLLFPSTPSKAAAVVIYSPFPRGSDELSVMKRVEGEQEPLLTADCRCNLCAAKLRHPVDYQDHLIVCPNVYVACACAPQGCPFRGRRVEMGSHLHACPFNTMKCMYARSGCDAILRRAEMEEHCKIMHNDRMEKMSFDLDAGERCPNRAFGCCFRDWPVSSRGPPPKNVVASVFEHLGTGHCKYVQRVCGCCGADTETSTDSGSGSGEASGEPFRACKDKVACEARGAIRAGWPSLLLAELAEAASKSAMYRNAVASIDVAPMVLDNSQTVLAGWTGNMYGLWRVPRFLIAGTAKALGPLTAVEVPERTKTLLDAAVKARITRAPKKKERRKGREKVDPQKYVRSDDTDSDVDGEGTDIVKYFG